MLPFLFTTLKRRLGTEDTKWWSVSGVILSHSSCKQVLRWATVRGLRCRFLRFKMRHTFSIGDRSGLQAGQSSTLPPQPGLCNVCRMWFCIVLLKYAWTSLEKMSSWRQHIVQSYLCQGHWHNPIPWQTLAFGLVAGNSLDDPFLLWSGAHSVHSSQKIPEILIHLTTVHVSTVWWSIPDASEPREVDGASGHC